MEHTGHEVLGPDVRRARQQAGTFGRLHPGRPHSPALDLRHPKKLRDPLGHQYLNPPGLGLHRSRDGHAPDQDGSPGSSGDIFRRLRRPGGNRGGPGAGDRGARRRLSRGKSIFSALRIHPGRAANSFRDYGATESAFGDTALAGSGTRRDGGHQPTARAAPASGGRGDVVASSATVSASWSRWEDPSPTEPTLRKCDSSAPRQKSCNAP